LSWWQAVKKEPAPPRYAKYRARVAAGLAAADCVVAPSVAMRDALVANYDSQFKCIVIPNGRDPAPFRLEEKRDVIFSCGRIWDEAKNLRLLDEIAPHVSWPISIAGDCQHPAGNTSTLKNARCLGKLSFEEIAQHFARAAIFALPACYEPFGLSALEAGLSGCALVLGDIPSLRETWQGAAVFVPPDDSSGLTNAIRGLIENNRRREHFGQRARARALEFSAQRMANSYLGIYRACGQQSDSGAFASTERQDANESPPLHLAEVPA
jgi:glycogen(starch) synthase